MITGEKMENTSRRARVWNRTAYSVAVTELQKHCRTNRLNKQKCSSAWQLDEFGRLVRRQQPHQILLPIEPIPDSAGGFLPGLELGAADLIRAIHKKMLHAGAHKVHQQLTKSMNYFVSRRAVEGALVNRCDVCLRQQVRRVVTPAVPVRAFWPTQRIQLDFIDCRNAHLFFPREMQPGNWDRGCKSRTEYKVDYVLVIVCVFSGYAWARPLYNNSQWEVCYEITKWANEFGWPQILHTDNGTPFDTRMLVSLCRKHDVFLVHGRPRHPQSQGKVERLNRTLKNMVRKMQEDDALLPAQPWLQHLAHAIFAYNRTPHSKTGVPPFVAFYGRTPTDGLTFTGEWEMCAVEREARDIVYSRKQYQSQDDQPQDDNDVLEYAEQLAAPNDDAERSALFTYLTKQQPLLLAQIRALQDHKNLEMVRRSLQGQNELKPVHPGDRVVFSKMSGIALGMAQLTHSRTF